MRILHATSGRLSLTGAFLRADFLRIITLNAIWVHFLGANSIPPKHAEQDQTDAKWLEESSFSDARVKEEVEAELL